MNKSNNDNNSNNDNTLTLMKILNDFDILQPRIYRHEKNSSATDNSPSLLYIHTVPLHSNDVEIKDRFLPHAPLTHLQTSIYTSLNIQYANLVYHTPSFQSHYYDYHYYYCYCYWMIMMMMMLKGRIGVRSW